MLRTLLVIGASALVATASLVYSALPGATMSPECAAALTGGELIEFQECRPITCLAARALPSNCTSATPCDATFCQVTCDNPGPINKCQENILVDCTTLPGTSQDCGKLHAKVCLKSDDGHGGCTHWCVGDSSVTDTCGTYVNCQ